MKTEKDTTFQKDIDDIFSDFIRAQKLFEVIMDSIGGGPVNADELDALDAATDYLNRVMEGFDALIHPVIIPGGEVTA